MTSEQDLFDAQDPARVGALLKKTGITLGMFDGELCKHLGVSRRTLSRWSREGTRLSRNLAVTLATLVYREDPSLAAELAALVGETLVSLGLEAAPPSLSASSRKLMDAVVCAAADAIDVSPRRIRPALLAALQSAREVGLTLEAMEALLRAPPG